MAMFNSYVTLQEGIGFDAFPLVRATELRVAVFHAGGHRPQC